MQQKEKSKLRGAAPRKYIYYYKKHNLKYEINQCETWRCFCALRDEMSGTTDETDSSKQQHVIQMTICELGPGLSFGQLHPREQLLTAISAAECSHSPHRIIHQTRKTLGRENMLPPKICMTDSSKAWLQFVGALQINELHLHFWRGRLHIHIKGEVKSLKSSLYPQKSEKRALNSSRSWVTMPTCTNTSSGEQARRRLKCVKSTISAGTPTASTWSQKRWCVTPYLA